MKRHIRMFIVLMIAFGMPVLFTPEPASAALTRAQQATDFCKTYPITATASKISRSQCRTVFISGYNAGGPARATLCKPASLKGSKLTSCNAAFNAGTSAGTAARASAAAGTTNRTCPGKAIVVSEALVPGGCIGSANQNPIFALIGFGVQFLTGLFGIILVLVLVIAGFQYVISGDDPEIAKEAKDRIKGAFTGLVLFVIMFALIQIILPSELKIFTSS
ncbi:MAG TPA: pilin [Candidatus Saccharimonadia bacterium]